MNGFIFVVPGVVSGLSVVTGLSIKGRWTRFLVIIGMSIWFIVGIFIVGISV
jgi:hypothetical protein